MDRQPILLDIENLPDEVRKYGERLNALSQEASALAERDDDPNAAEALVMRWEDLNLGL
jgi:uncharacterized protein YmfQ (DUF2313 family)